MTLPLSGRWGRRPYPWHTHRLDVPPVGLREIVLRVAYMTAFDVQQTAKARLLKPGPMSHAPLFYAVCDWRLKTPEAFRTLLALLKIVPDGRWAYRVGKGSRA